MRTASTEPTTPAETPDYVSLGITLIALATTTFAFIAVRMWPWLFVGIGALLIVKAVIAARAGRPDVSDIEERFRKLMHVRRRGALTISGTTAACPCHCAPPRRNH